MCYFTSHTRTGIGRLACQQMTGAPLGLLSCAIYRAWLVVGRRKKKKRLESLAASFGELRKFSTNCFDRISELLVTKRPGLQ
jgi:hypothetical protein